MSAWKAIHYSVNLGRFPFVRTGRPDHCPTSQLKNETAFSKSFCWKALSFVHAFLGFDGSGSRVLIKTEIIITTGMIWPVSSDKWKAPLSLIIADVLVVAACYLTLLHPSKLDCVTYKRLPPIQGVSTGIFGSFCVILQSDVISGNILFSTTSHRHWGE